MEEISTTPQDSCTSSMGNRDNNSAPREPVVGRWSPQEHEQFLHGYQKYGKDWKAIATMIPTRTVVQVRTHAQKYFQKHSPSDLYSLPLSIKRFHGLSYSRRAEEPEPRESSETSESTTPSESETSSTLENAAPVAPLESRDPTVAAAAAAVPSISVNVVSQNRGDVTVMYATSGVPSATHIPTLILPEHELSFLPVRNAFLHVHSPFEIECNTNMDDMDDMDDMSDMN